MRRNDWLFWSIVTIALVVVCSLAIGYTNRAPLVETVVQDLTGPQEQQLALFTQRVDVLLTLATLVLGGAGALLLHLEGQGMSWLWPQRWAALSLLTGGASILSGYFAYDSAIWMLRARFFDLENVALRVPSVLQLLGSGLSILFLVKSFLAVRGGEKQPGVGDGSGRNNDNAN